MLTGGGRRCYLPLLNTLVHGAWRRWRCVWWHLKRWFGVPLGEQPPGGESLNLQKTRPSFLRGLVAAELVDVFQPQARTVPSGGPGTAGPLLCRHTCLGWDAVRASAAV